MRIHSSIHIITCSGNKFPLLMHCQDPDKLAPPLPHSPHILPTDQYANRHPIKIRYLALVLLHQPANWRPCRTSPPIDQNSRSCEQDFQQTPTWKDPRKSGFLWILPLRSFCRHASLGSSMGRRRLSMEQCHHYWIVLWIWWTPPRLPGLGISGW